MTSPDLFAGVPAPLRSALEKRGFTQLTQVQAAVVAAIADEETAGRNLRISSQTGSGKTVSPSLRASVKTPRGSRRDAPAPPRW